MTAGAPPAPGAGPISPAVTLPSQREGGQPEPGQGPGRPVPGRKGQPVRLRALDGLRLLAALMVAAYHYGGRDGEIAEAWGASPREIFPTVSPYFSYGCLGVQIFFIISGFVICMSGWGARCAPSSPPASPGSSPPTGPRSCWSPPSSRFPGWRSRRSRRATPWST